jgi:hypothetical protein
VRSLATWFDGRLLQPFEYDLDGSPCRGVVTAVALVGSRRRFTPALFHAQGTTVMPRTRWSTPGPATG